MYYFFHEASAWGNSGRQLPYGIISQLPKLIRFSGANRDKSDEKTKLIAKSNGCDLDFNLTGRLPVPFALQPGVYCDSSCPYKQKKVSQNCRKKDHSSQFLAHIESQAHISLKYLYL